MISILLCTYNGERYISEQIESLLFQTYRDIRIYIHDDGSTDKTVDIIKLYEAKDSRIKYVQDDTKNRGARYSFMWLLQAIESDYYMFCDQDDVWMFDKIEKMMAAMKYIENRYPQTPLLVHSDMKIVDQNLNIIHNSLYRTMKIIPKYIDRFNFMGVCSCGPGCSMLFNDYSKKSALNYPDLMNIPMHDWWVAMNTVKNGHVLYLDQPTMLYRQHSNNAVGASNVSLSYMVAKLNNMKQTFSKYPEQFLWLRKIGYGGKMKFFFYKIIYSILRIIVRF